MLTQLFGTAYSRFANPKLCCYVATQVFVHTTACMCMYTLLPAFIDLACCVEIKLYHEYHSPVTCFCCCSATQTDRPLHTTCLVCLHGHFLKTTT